MMINTELKTKDKTSRSWGVELKKLLKITTTSLMLLNLTACATYKSSFNCGDSKGAYCASMDRVDQMINSGEIERFNEQRQKQQKYKPLKNSDTPKLKRQGVSTKSREESNAGI